MKATDDFSAHHTTHKCAFCGGKTDSDGRAIVAKPKVKANPVRALPSAETTLARLNAWAKG